MKKPSLGAIFLTVFLDLLGFGLVIPFLAKEARDTFGAAELTATLLGSTYSLAQFLFVPVWGRLSDRIGRRPVMLWSIAGTSLAMTGLGAGLAWGGSVAWLFVARGFAGIATANLGTASAYIADVTRPEERAKGMGLIGMAFGLGFILGPGIGGALAKIPVNGHFGVVPCFAAGALSAVNLIWAGASLVESLPTEKRAEKTPRSLAPLNVAAMKRAFARPGVALAVAVNFLIIASFTNLDYTFTFYCSDVFAIDERGAGYLLALMGVTAALVQGGIIRPLSKRVADASLVKSGAFFQIFAFAGLALAATFGRPMLYAAAALLAVGNGLTQPGTSAFISKAADPKEQGATLGTNQAFASLARTFGPASGGFLYGALGPRSPYAVAAFGMMVAFTLAMGMRQPPKDA
jgi:MFS family permease